MTYTIDLRLGTDTSSATVDDSGDVVVIEANHADVMGDAAQAEKHDVMLTVAIHLVHEVTRQRGNGPSSLDVSLPPDWDQSQVARLSEALAGSSIAQSAPAEPAPVDRGAVGSDTGNPGPSNHEQDNAPRVRDMYRLPHISEAPLPEFMAKRRQPEQLAAREPSAPQTPPADVQPTPSVDPTAAMVTQPPRPPRPPRPPASGRTLPPSDPDRSGRAGFVLIALLLLAIIGGGLYAANRARNAMDERPTATDQANATPSATTTPTETPETGQSTPPDASAPDEAAPDEATPDQPAAPTPLELGAGIVGADCETTDQPDPAIEYQVADVPDDLERQTLNGRNIPSIRTIQGVSSVAVTEFPEFSVLPLTYEDCSIDHNGRAWWGATFEGQLVWATTLFIEPVE